MEDQDYCNLACYLASDARDTQPAMSRGIWHLEKEDLLCIYDSHPYEDDPMARIRQNDRIARRIQASGIAILVETHDESGLTTVMLLDCSWDRIPLVHRIVCDEVDETLREIYSDY